MRMGAISVKQLDQYRNQQDYVIIDLRPQADYQKYHVNGAVNIPAENIWDNLGQLDYKKTYLLYCERGGKSTSVARDMARRGYKAVSVIGGIEAYKRK